MNPQKNECYRLIQQVAILQNPICKYPNCWKPSSCGHHIFSRSRLATAFLPEAVWGMCQEHHAWAHAHPMRFKQLAVSLIGFENYWVIARRSNEVIKHIDYSEIKANLKAILKGEKMDKCPLGRCDGTGWIRYGSDTEVGREERRCGCMDGVLTLFDPGPMEPRTVDGRVVFVKREGNDRI